MGLKILVSLVRFPVAPLRRKAKDSKILISKRNRDFLFVCSARALSNGCKSRVSPNSGNYIAKGKGVHRELESERSRRQTSDLTDRNFI